MDEYTSIDYGKNYLAHHGVKGMKWGVRNTIERMGISRKLRKNEKEYVKSQQQMLNAIKTRNDFKQMGGGRTEIAKQLDSNIKTISKNIKANRNAANKLIKEAKSKGYSVSTKNSRTGIKEQAIRGAKIGAAVRGAKYGLVGAATAAAYLGAAATVPITAPAAAIILGSYAVGTGAAGAIKGGLIGGAMGAGVGTALVSNQRKNGYRYADKVFNKNNDVPASILYKKYSVSDLKHFDELYSDYLAHYGIPGMKWGVRKSVERTGRVVRKMGGAVKNSASRIAGGLVRTGSAIRRLKNRRAIKSGNSVAIAKRVDKMTTQELSDAVTRAHLVSQLHNGGNSNSISLGDTVANSLKRKIGDMAANALQTTVTSAFRGESPLSAMARNAKAEKAQQEQQISNNRLQTISNNYRIGNSALQNQADIAKLNIQIASSNDRIQSLAKSQAPISSIKQTYSMPTGRRYVRRKLNSSNTYRYALYQDDMGVDEFLAHHGVLGMKWGVRKDDTGDIYVDADDVYRRRESSYKQPTNDIEDRGYTYVYDPSNTRDEEFYTQFGNRVVDKTFGEDAKIAGYESAGKAFADHIFETNDFHEVKYTDTMFKSAQKENGERHVMSLLSAPYDPSKSPEENRSNYENRLVEYGARTLGSGMGAERHPWLDDEEHREEVGRDPDTARNDAARRIADVLKNEGYIGMRDFKDIAGTAGVESPTILFNKDRNMYDEAYRNEIDKRLMKSPF